MAATKTLLPTMDRRAKRLITRATPAVRRMANAMAA